MHQPKFRMWSVKDKKFLPLVAPYGEPTALLFDIEGRTWCWSSQHWGMDNELMEDQHNYILQQSTGLKDKNGKEIYEGDFLTQTCDNKPCDYLVEWGNASEYCGFVLRARMKRDGTFRVTVFNFANYLAECFEVIGNMFENPELCLKYNPSDSSEPAST